MVKYIYSYGYSVKSLIMPSPKFAVSLHDDKAQWKEGYRQALKDVLEMNRVGDIKPILKHD